MHHIKRHDYFTVGIWHPVFDEPVPVPVPVPEPAPEPDAGFDDKQQEHINKLLAKERRDGQARTQKVLDEFNALKIKDNLTSDERTSLETRLEAIQGECVTKEQKAKLQIDKLTKTLSTTQAELTKRSDQWQSLYTNSTIDGSINSAASTNEAFDAQQIIAMLRPDTKLQEDIDSDGKPTGGYTAKVSFRDVDPEGKPVTLSLTVDEAVKRMTELPRYANLFRNKAVGGLGGSNSQTSAPNILNMLDDPKAYQAARKSGALTLEKIDKEFHNG